MLCSIASLTIILSVTWRIERLSLLFVSPTERRRNGDYNDKNIIHLPRHSSFMIMHTFAEWGNTGQNMAERLGITTVSTTKAHGRNRDKGKGVGIIP